MPRLHMDTQISMAERKVTSQVRRLTSSVSHDTMPPVEKRNFNRLELKHRPSRIVSACLAGRPEITGRTPFISLLVLLYGWRAPFLLHLKIRGVQ